jgi:hypothetical protein
MWREREAGWADGGRVRRCILESHGARHLGHRLHQRAPRVIQGITESSLDDYDLSENFLVHSATVRRARRATATAAAAAAASFTESRVDRGVLRAV